MARSYISNVTVERIGTDLYIEATRVNGWLTATVRYRYKPLSGGEYSEWKTILEKESTTSTVSITEPLGLNADESYEVVVGVLDSIYGHESNTTIIVPTDGVFMEKDGEMNSVSIGEPVSERDTVSIGKKMTVKVRKKIVVGADEDVQKNNAAELDSRHLKLGGNVDDFMDTNNAYLVDLEEDDYGRIGTYMIERGAGSVYTECSRDDNSAISSYVDKNGTRLVVGCRGGRAMLTGLTAPVDDSDAVNKAYVESLLASIYQELNAIKTALSNQ